MEEKSSVQKQPQTKTAECAFCYNQSQEIKTLLTSALAQAKKMLRHKTYSQMLYKPLNPVGNYSALHRLIRVLFEKQQFQIKFSKNCAHGHLRNRMMRVLGCQGDHFQIVVQDLCDKLARRNYQLQVISLQIKHVQNSVKQLEDSIQISTKARKESLSSQSQPIKIPKILPPVKIQSFQQPKIPSECLEKTSTAYQPAYDPPAYSYNVIFYGAPYYQ